MIAPLFRLLNPQGVAGLAVAAILGLLLASARIDARHFRKQADRLGALYRGEVQAHAQTAANARAAAAIALAADRANDARVRAAQSHINERSADDFENRLAAARARAQRLRPGARAAAAPGGGAAASLPALSAAPGGAADAAEAARLSDALTATEQAIQLDELIKWVRAQAAVETSGPEK